jgi:hypothetical protein
MLPAYTVAPHVLLLLQFPDLYRVSLADPLDNAFLMALSNLATRREIELNITHCHLAVDVSSVSAFELRIATLTAMRDARDVLRTYQGSIYQVTSASSCHLHYLSLGSEIGNIKFIICLHSNSVNCL